MGMQILVARICLHPFDAATSCVEVAYRPVGKCGLETTIILSDSGGFRDVFVHLEGKWFSAVRYRFPPLLFFKYLRDDWCQFGIGS